MNREVFALRADEPSNDALSYVLALGVTGAPVVNDADQLIGMISLRDLMTEHPGNTTGQRMTCPAVSVPQTATIRAAGKLMGETGYHRLAVTDSSGQLVGVLSSLDIIRGLLGMPASHPATFPHYDPYTNAVWTDDHQLEFARVEAAPEGPGVIVLVRGGAATRESIAWVEAATDVRHRLLDLLSLPEEQSLTLRKVLSYKELRYRATSVQDAGERERLVGKLLGEMRKRRPS